MRGSFRLAKANNHCIHIPDLGEVFLYEYDPVAKLWDTRIGDGKTPAKDLPRLANYDIYERVAKLEREIEQLKNRRI
jgi:uncharacterized small protein (DUF1192 family)